MSAPPGADTDASPTFPWRRAVVVGGTSGIGEAVVRRLVKTGVTVAVVGRREDRLHVLKADLDQALLTYRHDVRDAGSVPGLFEKIVGQLDGLDLIVYAAGVLPVTGAMEFPSERDLDTLAINLNGAVAWLNPAADRFARTGRGTIVGISSVAGDRGRRGNPAYNASKAGLSVYLESLRNRLAIQGVTVLTVKPGYVRTAMLDNNPPGPLPVIDADRAAEEILDAAAAGKRVVYVPGWWRIIMTVVGVIPAPIFERLPF